jgi:DNA-binding response OmpR family regulator
MSIREQGGRTVLCIGDEAVHLNLRCSFLREHGWNVLSSGSGHEGLLRFGTQAINIVILDLNSGGVEGALVAGECKRIRPHVQIVMLITDRKSLVEGALESADVVMLRSEESTTLLDTLRALPKVS